MISFLNSREGYPQNRAPQIGKNPALTKIKNPSPEREGEFAKNLKSKMA